MRYAVQALIVSALVLLFFGFISPRAVSAQEAAAFDTPPAPVGGMAALMQAVSYPKAAAKEGIEGKVLLSVTIDVAGKVKSVTVKQGVRNDLDQTAVKALEKTSWSPAEKDGKPVACTVIVPIQFKLEDKIKK